MDLLTRHHSMRKDAQEGPAIMLFGKQINNLSPQMAQNGEKIREELLSPRGVDEKGLPFATTSSDDEDVEDLKENYRLEVACEEDARVQQVVQQSALQQPYLASSMVVPTAMVAREPAMKRKRSDAADGHGLPQSDGEASRASSVSKARDDRHDTGCKAKAGAWSRCPRCNSADTKFCYFNNYNVNQPRHFCKNCQRYWTAGGTLRNVPVGAGKRKNKHALHVKHGFIGSLPTQTPTDPAAISLTMASTSASQDHPPVPTSKPEPPLSLAASSSPSTDLELSASHPLSAGSPMPMPCFPCTQSRETSAAHACHPHPPQHQLHGNRQSISSRMNHSVYSNLSQVYPHLQHVAAPGLSQICPALRCEYSELARVGSHLGSRPSPWCYACPDHVQSGSPRLYCTCPHVRSGSARQRFPCPHTQNGCLVPRPTCLHAQRYSDDHHTRDNMLSVSAKPERESPANPNKLRGNPQRELPTSDHKNASNLAEDLPDLAKKMTSGGKQRGFSDVDPNEVHPYIKRCSKMKPVACSSSNDCKVYVRGKSLEHINPMPCLQGDNAPASSHSVQSEDAGNTESILKQSVGDDGCNSLPMVGPLWPCFPNMFWLDPLAFPHVVRPVVTHQGWALPFATPGAASKVEPISQSHHISKAP